MSLRLQSFCIGKGGKLIGTYWNPNTRKYVEKRYKKYNGVPTANHLHSMPCTVADDVTLKDIFLYINKNIDLWELFLGNWCKDIVKEGLKPLKKKSTCDYTEIENIELYGFEEVSECFDAIGDTEKKEFSGFKQLNLSGNGHWKKDCEEGTYKKGEKVSISLSFVPNNELAKYKLIVKEEAIIYGDIGLTALLHVGRCTPSLFQILYSIIWELSFFGSPQDRDKHAKELNQTMDNIKSGKVKTYPMDELFGEKKEVV